MSEKKLKLHFTGTPSTGKTTLCSRLAQEFNDKARLEYYRDYLNSINELVFPTPAHNLLKITQIQEEQENELINECEKFLFCDSGSILYYVGCLSWHDKAPEELKAMALNAKNRYDFIFLCNDDLQFDENIPRPDKDFCNQLQIKLIDFLNENKIPYVLLDGDLEGRVNRVKEIIMEN